MATFIATETRPNTSLLFINDDPRYSERVESMENELASAGIVTTIETSSDGLVRTHSRTMTEDKILTFKNIYDTYIEEISILLIENNDTGHWGIAQEMPDPSAGIVLQREWADERDYQIYTGEIVL